MTTVTTTTTFGWCARESDDASNSVFGFAALYQAWQACRRGKRGTRKAQHYEIHLLDRLVDTSAALQKHAWHPSRATRFVTLQPKPREILASEFADRVVHHLLVPWLERLYEPVFIHDSFANRKGKGTHAAVQRLQSFTGRQKRGYYLQLDISNFFNSINRRKLFSLLQERIRRDLRRPVTDSRHCKEAEAQQMLWLARLLLTGNPAESAVFHGHIHQLQRVPAHKQLINAAPETGLPIGNLTSQFFANVYLNELDQFIKHQLKVREYVRYVDDFVLLDSSPEQLQKWRSAIIDFLQNELHLQLRDAGKLAAISQGIDFLGYIVRPSYLLVRRRVVVHLHDKLRRIEQQWQRCDGSLRCTPEQTDHLHALLASYWGHFSHAQSRKIRADIFQRYPWLQHWLHADEHSGTLKRRDRPCHPSTLPEQWRWFRYRYPHHVLMMQVGREWKCSHDPGSGAATQRRYGLPPTQNNLRRHQLLQLQRTLTKTGQPWLVVMENGYQRNGRKQRQLGALSPNDPSTTKPIGVDDGKDRTFVRSNRQWLSNGRCRPTQCTAKNAQPR